MKQKLQKLLIAIAGLLFSANAFALNKFYVDGIYYYIISSEDRTVRVSTTDNFKYTGNISIPPKVTYNSITYSVTEIGNLVFRDCTDLTSVIIPSSVTIIRDDTFSGCTGLKSVAIGDSVTWIGINAFYGCTSLTSVTIPNSVTVIAGGAFEGCTGLKSVAIGDSVTRMGNMVFYGCTSLTSVTIPNSVTEISSSVFSGCTGLKSVTIGNSMTEIPSGTFYGCTSLKSVTIGNSVTKINENAFSQNQDEKIELKKVIWLTNTSPTGYTNVYSDANYVSNDQYSSLNNVTIYPYLSSMFEVDGVKYVPVSPSERICDAIDCVYDSTATNINIGNNVSHKGIYMRINKIKPYTFFDNDCIKNVTINIAGDIPDYCFYGCSRIETATITAEAIGNSSFMDCRKVHSITFGKDLKSIDYSAFNGCRSLNKINIPDSVTNMGTNAFYKCSSLKSVHIGAGISVINNATFYGCSSLPEITIPSNVSSIGDYVFSGCSSLADVTIADRETELSLGSNGSSPLFSNCPLKTVYIGGNISYPTSSVYGYSPFYRNTTLETVIITDKETEISENEFYGCSSLKNIAIGNGVEKIGNWAFSGCSSLDYFEFGSGMKKIGEEVFSDCTAMTNLISRTVTPPSCGTQALDDINKWSCELIIPKNSLSAYQGADQWKEFFYITESGIEDITVDESAELSVSVDGDEIIVNNAENYPVTIYSLAGQQVYCNNAYNGESISLSNGVYIVKAGSKTQKVII